MSLNFREIDAIITELPIIGSKVQNIIQNDFSSLYIELFDGEKPVWLYICLQAGLTRLHSAAPPRKIKGAQPRFSEFLRARLRGATIASIAQYGIERIVHISFEGHSDNLDLYIRLWGNAANIIAVNLDGTIADAFYRRPQKQEVSGKTFSLPPHSSAIPDQQRYQIRAWPQRGSFNEYIEEYYRQTSQELQFTDQKERLNRQIKGLQTRFAARQQALQNQIAQFSQPDRFKQLGEMVLAQAHAIIQGQKWIEIDDWYNPGHMLRIELDPKATAVANAERYFQKFRKARDGIGFLRAELSQIVAAVAAIALAGQQLAQAEQIAEIRQIATDIAKFSELGPKKKSGYESERPGLAYTSHGFLLLIGRSAAENDVLLRSYVRGNDYWLHVRDFPGGYVFIKVPREKSVPLEVLVDAAHLAAWYSKAKGELEVDLFYTQVKYLRRAKHGTYGTVIPTRERNLHVRIDSERVNALKHLLNAPGG